ncbi:hypothetical protein [Streptomyces sp. 1222.5]
MKKALPGLGLQTVLGVHGEEQGRKLTFPPACKAAGRDLASRLAATAG